MWTRVYFYAVIGIALSMGLFASPAKAYLIRELKKRQAVGMKTPSEAGPPIKHMETQQKHPVLGMPDDPAGMIDEAVKEIQQEVEARRRKGSLVSMPRGQALRNAVENKVESKLEKKELQGLT